MFETLRPLKGVLLVASLLLACTLQSRPAAAIAYWNWGWPPLWNVTCDNGYVFGPYASLDLAMTEGKAECEEHGGVAEITEDMVQAALGHPENCATPSHVTIGRELPGGGYELLTPEEFLAILEAAQASPGHLQGLRVLSVVVRGVELFPAAPAQLSPIELHAIYSDDEGDDVLVGGLTDCGAVPLGPLSVGEFKSGP